MLYRVGTKKELSTLPCVLPEKVYAELLRGLAILDAEYGAERDSLLIGGFSLIAENREDVSQIKNYVDYDRHPPEWVTKISTTGYLSALFIMNNDFSIMVYLPVTIAPEAIKKELEE